MVLFTRAGVDLSERKQPTIDTVEICDKKLINTQRLKGDVVLLNGAQRNYVEEAVRETCRIRKWNLLAANVRTNHVHTAVSIGTKKPEIALNSFKANATKKKRERRLNT